MNLPPEHPSQAGVSSVLERLPHGEAFCFLSRVDALEAQVRGRGVWVVGGEEGFFAGHFPGRPIVPGVLIGEALAQLSGIVGLTPSRDGKRGRESFSRDAGAPVSAETTPDPFSRGAVLAQIDLRLKRPVIPPAEIVLESTLQRVLGALSQYDVRAAVDGHTVASGSLTLAQPEETMS